MFYTVNNFSEHLESLEYNDDDRNCTDLKVKIIENRLNFDDIESNSCYILTGLYIYQLKDFVSSFGELKSFVKLSLLIIYFKCSTLIMVKQKSTLSWKLVLVKASFIILELNTTAI